MAILKFVSTTGMFHSALSVSYDGGPQRWAGFKPKVNKAPFGEGIIDSTDETPWINYWATYDIEDDLMTRSIIQVGVKYFQSEYIVLVNDCVSFTADVARAVGLKVPTFNPGSTEAPARAARRGPNRP